MKKMLKILVSVMVMICLMSTVSIAAETGMENFKTVRTYSNGKFIDVASSQWYYTSVVRAYELGLMSGTAGDTFCPGGNITIAETITLAARVNNIYYGSTHSFITGDTWYQDYVKYAEEHGIIARGAYSSSYSRAATRKQFAMIMASALPEKELPAINNVAVIPDVTKSQTGGNAIYMLYNAGILCGSDAFGTFRPDSNITRSEVSAIVTRIAIPADRKIFTLREMPAEEAIVMINGVQYYLGMPSSELSAPNEKLSSVGNFTYYVYGTGNYQSFLAVGVADSQVVSITSVGRAFNYRGLKAGGTSGTLPNNNSEIDFLAVTDPYDSNRINSISVFSSGYSLWTRKNHTVNATTLYGESRMNFHLTNAFRVYHGLNKVTWSSKAAEAARLHSQEMADYVYFDHLGRDGSRGWDRMKRQGISYTRAGENISSGYNYAFRTFASWVTSEGHRKIMLGNYTYMGSGGGYNSSKSSTVYYTQDYYA